MGAVRRWTNLGLAGILVLALASTCSAGITIEHAFCRGGQVFLHWSDPGTPYAHYHIYRSAEPITQNNVASADLIDPNAPLHSAKDMTASYVASRTSKPDPNIGLRLYDLDTPLDPTDCLEVITVTTSASNYYAVVGVNPDDSEDSAIIPGVNSLTIPIDEQTGPPAPVLEQEGANIVGGYTYPWKIYTWYRRSDETPRDGEPTKLTITFPTPDMTRLYQTILDLHAIGGVNKPFPWWSTIIISPCDYTSALPYTHNTWWSGCSESFPNVSSGIVVNCTENMLLHMLDWAKANWPVDSNKVFLQGGSMGGTGSVSFGLRHPEIFAGISAQVPQVNPGLPGIGWSQDQLQGIWGSVATNLPTNEGVGIWDRMNMTEFVRAHKEDLPFLQVQNSKNDDVLFWFQIPDFYRSLNESKHGFVAAWGQGGHVSSSSGLPSAYLGFSIFNKLKLNQSYVVVSNSSASDDPGNGDPLDGDSVGQMNAGYDWTIVSDTDQEWIADVKYTAGGSATADISARRLQDFQCSEGDQLAYSVRNAATGSILAQGRVTAERDSFFTIPSLSFDSTSSRLAVWRSSGQTASELDSLADGESVDLDAVVVTAVFPDVCYAQAAGRIPCIAIIGATGLAEGNLVHLRGTKTTFGKMPAVSASPADPPAYGTASLEPLGLPHPFATLDDPAELGSLVKIWGSVESANGDEFTIQAGGGSTLIFGDVGTPPQLGALVSVVGICSRTSGRGQPPYGIRVRHASDTAAL